VDTVAGTARQTQPILDYPSDQVSILHLTLEGTALWVRSGTALRLERLDGTAIRVWDNAVDGLPDSTWDGAVLLVPLADGWHRATATGETVLAMGGYGADLSQDGRFVGYLKPAERREWYTVRVFDSETGADVAVHDVRVCNCGISLQLSWDAQGRLLYRDFSSPSSEFGLAPGRFFRYEPASGQVEPFTPTRLPRVEPSAHVPLNTASCPAGIVIDHPGVPPALSCVAGATAAAWSPDRKKVAYFLDGYLHVLEPGASRAAAELPPVFRPIDYWVSPGLQWDPSGRYIVIATRPR
jgi:hypothetical protein